ncbi:MAG: 2TM domain-containing protein [Polyangiaceae bacterium]|nr:2TM domain-containing protein [Polyangiaceae bacterium]
MSDSGPRRRYTDDEARAIFERALGAEANATLGHEDLVAAAAEVGISRDAVERAVAEVETQQAERMAKASVLSRRRRGLLNHFIVYFVINGFLFLINWLTSPGAWWFLFPVAAWGLGLFFHMWHSLSSRVSPRALRRQLTRAEGRQRHAVRQLREDERARRRLRHERIEEGARQLGEAVEEGVAAVLNKLASELRQVPTARPRVDVAPPEPAAQTRSEAEIEAKQRMSHKDR